MDLSCNYNLKVIDLFAGVGGLSLGAARAGFAVSLAVEIDKHAIKSHKTNFPATAHLDTSVTDIAGEDLIAGANIGQNDFWGIVGGPPCQGFSRMGNRDPEDPRSNLFGDFFRLVSEAKPTFFLAENVPGILDSDFDEIRNRALGLVSAEYCAVEPFLLRANDFGAATNRERVFFVGVKNEISGGFSKALFSKRGRKPSVSVKKALQGLPKHIGPEWRDESNQWKKLRSIHNVSIRERFLNGRPSNVGDPESISKLKKKALVSGCQGTVHTEAVTSRYSALAPGETDTVSRGVRLDPNGLCPTLRAGTGPDKGSYQAVRPIHPSQARVITPREAARLQGFPDWFQFHSTKWHSFRQIGNSVSPLMAEFVLRKIRFHLDRHL